MSNLFVYGSLMNDEIVSALTGTTFAKVPAELDDFLVSKVPGKATPGMIRMEGLIARGFILLDIHPDSLKLIEDWEGNSYTLIETKTVNNKVDNCSSFLWLGDVLNVPWDNATFRKNDLRWYLKVDIPKFLGH